jgi:hypothetical protein
MKRTFSINYLAWMLTAPLAWGGSTATGHCPAQDSVDLLKHTIAYERHGGGPFATSKRIHVRVWEQGKATVFYIADRLANDAPTLRMAYYYFDGALENTASCYTDETWQLCVQKGLARSELDITGSPPRTCSITVDVAAIPPWVPSPDTEQKRRIAAKLKQEATGYWGETTELVIRDFNLRDHEILFWSRGPGPEEGCVRCWFRRNSVPHCRGWLLFGQTPQEYIKSLIFARPYKLK